MEGHCREVRGTKILPGGRIVSWSADATIRWWSNNGQPDQTWHGQAPIRQALPRPDGTVVLVLKRGPLAILSATPPGKYPPVQT